MDVDIYNLRARLKKVLDRSYIHDQSFYDQEYIEGVNFVLDHLTAITGVHFGHYTQKWDPM